MLPKRYVGPLFVGVVTLGTAGEILLELRIGIVEPVLADGQTDGIILSHDGRIPLRRVVYSRAEFLDVILPLFVEPDVFEAPAVEQAVYHYRQTFDLRQPAACRSPAALVSARPSAAVSSG